MKCFAAFGLLLLSSLLVQGQVTGSGGTVSSDFPYRIIKSKPYEFHNLLLGGGVQVGTRPLNQAELLTTWFARYSYKSVGYAQFRWDVPALSDYDYQYEHLREKPFLQTTDQFYIYNVVDATIGYFLKDTIKLVPRAVQFSVHDSALNNVDPAVMYDLPIRFQWSARLGYYRYQSIANNLFLNEDQLLDVNGFAIAQGGPESIFNPMQRAVYHTNFSVNAIAIGADFRMTTNTILRVEGKNRRQTNQYVAYADFLIAPAVTIQDMTVRDFVSGEKTTYQVGHSNGGGFEKRSWGFRLGGQATVFLWERAALDFGIETGIRPGLRNAANPDALIGSMAYVQGKIGYVFGMTKG